MEVETGVMLPQAQEQGAIPAPGAVEMGASSLLGATEGPPCETQRSDTGLRAE